MKHRQQRGQVIPYVAFLILILTAAGLIVFDVGHLINARIKSQNAADAAALAAVAVKINKHHVDTLVRAAMTQESIIAQAEVRAAQAVVLQAFIKGSAFGSPALPEVPNPTIPDPDVFKDLRSRYRTHANKAYKHALKLHRERLALQAYYQWLAEKGPLAVQEGARTAYALNMQGYDDLNDKNLQKNITEVLAKSEDLAENQSRFGEIGGFAYANEAAVRNGVFGKSLVEMKTFANASDGGTALLKYLQQFELTSSAAAQLLKRPEETPLGPMSFVAMNWYSPHLMAIEGETPSKVLH
ncbi:MAG: hypothetical protein IGS03_02870 [Candidatus Sericytochromatia bacterium]|nr:hypothetical protein [Candidatus Sericytochromatia bacterium]